MPGSRLNDTENALRGRWRNGGYPFPTLRGLAINGNPGLRGIQNLDMSFDYPVTAICGRNGTGKTTLLSLCALAFHAIPGHEPLNAIRRPKLNEDFNYYTFRDFFFQGPSDPDLTGITLKWEFSDHDPIEIRKQSQKWMRYERRPNRPVHYLGISRTIPASEVSALRSRFPARRVHNSAELSSDSLQRLGEIMGREYTDAQIVSDDRYSVRTAQSGGRYSSFNMGTGEDIVIEVLNVLDTAPDGSLIAIEEVELGLHPEALRRLAQHLQEIAFARSFQMVLTTHSEYFLDALPRIARVLVQRSDSVHQAIPAPTTRFAIGSMTGRPDPELKVYCEDAFSKNLIGASLDSELRSRVEIIEVGSNSELAEQATFHQRAGLGHHQLIVWDGDVSDNEARRYLRQASDGPNGFDPGRANWTRLPGAEPPEKWLLRQLDCEEGRQALAGELKMSGDQAAGLLGELLTVTEAHNIVGELGLRQNLREDEACRDLLKALTRLPPRPLEPITSDIQTILAGGRVANPPEETGET